MLFNETAGPGAFVKTLEKRAAGEHQYEAFTDEWPWLQPPLHPFQHLLAAVLPYRGSCGHFVICSFMYI